MWILDLIDPIAAWNFEGKAKKQRERDDSTSHTQCNFIMPARVEPEASVVKLILIEQPVKLLKFEKNGEDLFATLRMRFSLITHEAYAFRHRSVVHVYQVVSVGREFQRTLVYTSEASLALHHFPTQKPQQGMSNAETEDEEPKVANPQAQKYVKKALAIALVQQREGHSGLGRELIAVSSCVIKRSPPDLSLELAQKPRSSTFGGASPRVSQIKSETRRETFVSSIVLRGVLPEVMVEAYNFFREEESHVVRGYSKKAEESSPHVIVLQLEVDKIGVCAGEPGYCTSVYKHFLREDEEGLLLLNLMSAEPGQDLYSLLDVLMKLDHIAFLLVWSRP